MKIVCAWCGKVLKEASEKEVSHVICPECYAREVKPYVQAERQAREEQEFKLPPPPLDWFDFLHRQMLFSLAVGGLFFAAMLATEGLHWITSGKVPSLIEWIVKQPLKGERYQLELRETEDIPHLEIGERGAKALFLAF